MASRLVQIPESLLVKLWRERASREKYLRAGDGRRLRVLYPGRISTTAGPDFRDALLEQEGVGLVRGDVEVHVSQRDWEAHGHGNDPRYNGVVLHVVGDMGTGPTILRSGSRVPVLSLEQLLQSRQSQGEGPGLWFLLETHGYSPPGNPRELGVLLDEAGDSRFLGKSDSFLAFLQEKDQEQVLYASLMEALGYSQNREPFLNLAYSVPYRHLEKAALSSPPGEGRVEDIQETLLAAAGFLPSSSNRRAMSQSQWHLFRVRPQNHPRQRITGFAHVLDILLPSSSESGPESWMNVGLVKGMAGLVRAGQDTAQGNKGWKALESGLMGTWPSNTRQTSSEDSAKRRTTPIGKGRARDIAVNCVLPFIHARARLYDDASLANLALEVYRSFPSLQENELTREMRQQLLSPLYPGNNDKSGGDGDRTGMEWTRIVDNARRQQGLLHLHHLIASPGTSTVGKPG